MSKQKRLHKNCQHWEKSCKDWPCKLCLSNSIAYLNGWGGGKKSMHEYEPNNEILHLKKDIENYKKWNENHVAKIVELSKKLELYKNIFEMYVQKLYSSYEIMKDDCNDCECDDCINNNRRMNEFIEWYDMEIRKL
jgi:hypothetical protein